ncbi:MAG: homocysteine S-methyltransferase family protein [Hyphomicrobiales bacterium]|nr:homocysteine S-methyltransferase family protein [Hyphomicrobiales bacterium]
MTGYEKLMNRIAAGERIMIDGATGTEIERRGVPQLDNAWNGGGALSHPDIVRQVHEDYLREGAEIIISNTFATSRHALRDAGVEDQFEAYNRCGVELAIEARDNMQKPDALVAGGISYWSWTGAHPALETLRASVEEQTAIMAAAGADLLMLEMMIEMDRMLVTLEAAQTSGLPVWAGLTCQPDETGTMCLSKGDRLTDALAELTARGVPLVSIMHTEVEHIDACLDVLKDHWPGPIGVYAHTGGYADGKWIFDDTISPHDYAENARRWLDRGVQIIGGCCGIRVDHIAELRKAV